MARESVRVARGNANISRTCLFLRRPVFFVPVSKPASVAPIICPRPLRFCAWAHGTVNLSEFQFLLFFCSSVNFTARRSICLSLIRSATIVRKLARTNRRFGRPNSRNILTTEVSLRTRSPVRPGLISQSERNHKERSRANLNIINANRYIWRSTPNSHDPHQHQ